MTRAGQTLDKKMQVVARLWTMYANVEKLLTKIFLMQEIFTEAILTNINPAKPSFVIIPVGTNFLTCEGL